MAECSSSIEGYDFNHKYRGQALIFIQHKFIEVLTTRNEALKTKKNGALKTKRNGALKDLEKMKELFEGLDFKVKVYKDLSSTNIKDKLKKAADCKYNKDSDCFACVFSTHGSEEPQKDWKQNFITWKNVVYGKDGIPIIVDDILDIFSDKNCPTLIDKPKLFFIQACRSRHERPDQFYDLGRTLHLIRQQSRNSAQGSQRAHTDSVDNTCTEIIYDRQPSEENASKGDLGGTARIETATNQMTLEDSDIMNIYEDWSEDEDTDEFIDKGEEPENYLEIETDETDVKGGQDSHSIPDVPVELTPINCPNDCLVVYPVMSGKVAFRNEEGSWLLNFLYKNHKLLIEKRSLLQYITKVFSDMAAKNFIPTDLNWDKNPANYIQTKATANLIHKLSKDVIFTPKNQNTVMAFWQKKFQEISKRCNETLFK